MHFALPPRKTSRPPPYMAARSSHRSYFKRARVRSLAWIVLCVVCLLLLLSRLRPGHAGEGDDERIPPGTPPIVIVTVIDRDAEESYRQLITHNREDYAARHGYAIFLANISDYPLSDPLVSNSWARIPATRHAMSVFPHSTFFFFLEQDALILEPSTSLTTHLLNPTRLESLYLPDRPVVPPDSVIKTYPHRRFDQVDLILTQDHEGLSQGSFVLRRGAWALFFLDAWFDPLYRTYNFQRAEGHALEHLVQWHGSVLSRMALVPQRTMNSYTVGQEEELYVAGDFVARLKQCNGAGPLCEKEARQLLRTTDDYRGVDDNEGDEGNDGDDA